MHFGCGLIRASKSHTNTAAHVHNTLTSNGKARTACAKADKLALLCYWQLCQNLDQQTCHGTAALVPVIEAPPAISKLR